MPDLPKGIERLKSGAFRASVWSSGRRVTKCFATVGEAEAFRLACLQEIADGVMVVAKGARVCDWGGRWLKLYRSKNRSYANDKQRWYSHVEGHAIGRMPIAGIEERHVETWLRELEAKDLAFRTRRNCRILLLRFFEDAKRQHLADENPVKAVRVEGELPPIAEDWYLTPPEQKRLLEAIPEPERWMVAFAMATGIRRGELFALHLHDVRDDSIFIRYGGFTKGGQLRTPKNKKTRVVALNGFALDALQRWQAALSTYAPRNPHGLAFPHATGARRVYSRDVPRSFHVAAKKISRLRPWWHMLRHTCASSLIAGWWGERWSLDDVCAALGHSSVTVTERYAHLAPHVLEDKAQRTAHSPLTGSRIVAESMEKLWSRPGDLKSGPTPVSVEDPGWRERAVSALRATADADPRALAMLVGVVAEVLPAEVRRDAGRGVA